MCITASADTLSREMSCLYHSQHQTACLFLPFLLFCFHECICLSWAIHVLRWTVLTYLRSLSMNELAHLPWARHHNGRVSPRVLWPGHCDMVIARLLLMLCLGPAEGKVQGREEPPRQWLVMGKSIKWCWWCQTPAGGWAGNEREMSCLGWGPGRARTAWCLHPPGDSFTHHYYMSASQSLLIITVYVISGIQDSVTLSISSLRRVYLTSRLRLRSVGESPSNWGSQESTVLYCAVLCAPVQAAEIRQCPAITAMLSQMDQRGHQVIVSKKVYFLEYWKADS